MVAIAAPILGAIADYAGFKKRLFTLFTLIGIFGTVGLALVPDNKIWWLLFIFMLANIGYSAANIFYDAFLTDVTTDIRMNRVSSAGYGFGYLGGVIPFVIFYLLRGLMTPTTGVMFAFMLASVWWLLWTIPMWRTVDQVNFLPTPQQPFTEAIQRIITTIKNIAKYPDIAWFLLAYFFYIDGVNTIFTEATMFGAAVGIKMTTLLTVLLAVQIIAFPSSIIYGRLANYFGTRKVLVGTSQGGIQALSRSYFGKLVPKDQASEFFGFYNIFGKFSAILGPLLFGTVAQMTGQVQLAAGSLIVLFGVGLAVFIFTPTRAD